VPDAYAERTSAALPDAPAFLGAYTTLRLGGPAGQIVEVTDPDEAVAAVRRTGGPLLVLAGGSNVVVADEGFAGTVLLLRTRGVDVVDRAGDAVVVEVAAGEPWDDFVARTVAEGWTGVECLSGVPGSVGATPIQNVGAYGQEVAETIVGVQVYDRADDEVRWLDPEECRFAYRTSIFKHSDRWLVLRVRFRLIATGRSAPVRYAELARALGVEVGGRVPLAQAREAVLRLRAGKAMVLADDDPDTWSVGSFFTNPVLSAAAYRSLRERTGEAGDPPAWPGPDGTMKVSAAWLIERAGFHKGYGGAGGVAISGRHTLALTNRGDGTTAALLALARTIRNGVQDRFGVVLHPEPVLVNCEL
jgi:UDP-N-acetylmuramate dehydrogenase